MKIKRTIIFLILALGMVWYAVPQLHINDEWSFQTIFGFGWIAFALLVISAYLHHLLGVDEQTHREMQKVKRMRKWQTKQLLSGNFKHVFVKK